ncbi:heavy-metal-associated domain-containing protein [Zeaxanthinibacter sp. PT1]|uniref:heavy-metal-associated domain-containing protein n=1 Tax=Zeaxanthinibacter TaxID=561554 RepID=UPI00234B36A0|nr:heavy-metal-associated domain-containing protein [Zeaxanthinibacter sp. PT1]MDC6350787.1 heavy-metal-associated domain-containing protein [Zeaxanthinibacter sp. PT1]
MKNLIAILMITFAGLSTIQAQQGMDKFQVQVDGLGCPFCAYGLEKKFKEFKGIKDVAIDIETGDFTFSYPAEKALSLEAVEKQVEKAGYTPIAGGVTRSDGTIEALHGKKNPVVANNTKTVKGKTMVSGNCSMCQARIEKAAMDQVGVQDATWDKNTKILEVQYDETMTSIQAVEEAIARVGHDTEHHKAHEEAYENLPGCCQYERIESKKQNK